MKKVGKISAGVMGLLLSLGMAVNPVAALTVHHYADWKGEEGTITKVNDNVTNLKGASSLSENNTNEGAYVYDSDAKLSDEGGITEQVHVYLDVENMDKGKAIHLSNSLDYNGSYATEARVRTTIGEESIVVDLDWNDSLKATITESGVYTYQWHWEAKEDKVMLVVSVLKEDTVIDKSDEIDMTEQIKSVAQSAEIKAEGLSKFTAGYIWFYGIEVKDGVNVYSELPSLKVEATVEEGVVSVPNANELNETLKESFENNKELADLLDKEDVNVTLEANEMTTVADDTKTSFEKVAGNGKIAEYLDIEVVVTAGEKTYNLHELTKPVSLTVAIPTSVPAVKDGYTRTYYILREHDGKVEKLNATLSEDGKNLTFATDKFSTYALAYEDTVVEPTVDNPTTGDAIMMYASIGLLSMGMLVFGVKTLKKRNN